MLSQALNSNTIQLDVEADDFKDAIRKAVKPLEKAGDVTSQYVEEILSILAETGPYIVLTKNIALPHAPSNKGALKVGLGFTKLKKPVLSGSEANDPVKYLFPLSAPDNTSHIELLSELAELLGDEKFIAFLEKVETKEEFIQYLKKFEGVI
jgi:PTS system ascorbate-specific IIA component